MMAKESTWGKQGSASDGRRRARDRGNTFCRKRGGVEFLIPSHIALGQEARKRWEETIVDDSAGLPDPLGLIRQPPRERLEPAARTRGPRSRHSVEILILDVMCRAWTGFGSPTAQLRSEDRRLPVVMSAPSPTALHGGDTRGHRLWEGVVRFQSAQGSHQHLGPTPSPKRKRLRVLRKHPSASVLKKGMRPACRAAHRAKSERELCSATTVLHRDDCAPFTSSFSLRLMER